MLATCTYALDLELLSTRPPCVCDILHTPLHLPPTPLQGLMNPWASPWADEAEMPSAAPTSTESTNSPPMVLESKEDVLPIVPPVSLDVDPWSAVPVSPEPAEPAVAGEQLPTDVHVKDLNTPSATWNVSMEQALEPTADDAHLASLTSASLMMHENVWNEGDSMPRNEGSTESNEPEEKEDNKASLTQDAEHHKPATVASAEADDAAQDTTSLTPGQSELVQQDEKPQLPPPETSASEASGSHVLPTTSQDTSDSTSTTATTTKSSVGSAISRLGSRMTEWRQARAAAAQEAKKAAEAEQAQGWKRVTPPTRPNAGNTPSTAAASRISGWLKRSTKSSTPSDKTPSTSSQAEQPSKTSLEAQDTQPGVSGSSPNFQAVPPMRSELAPTQGVSSTLNADDLAWLDAATTKKAPSTTRPSLKSGAYDPAPLYDDPYEDTRGPILDAETIVHQPDGYDPCRYDPDDTDEFGDIQAYTDDDRGAATLYDAPYLPKPGPFVHRGGGEQYGSLETMAALQPSYKDEEPVISHNKAALPPALPLPPPPAPASKARTTNRKAASDSKMPRDAATAAPVDLLLDASPSPPSQIAAPPPFTSTKTTNSSTPSTKPPPPPPTTSSTTSSQSKLTHADLDFFENF